MPFVQHIGISRAIRAPNCAFWPVGRDTADQSLILPLYTHMATIGKKPAATGGAGSMRTTGMIAGALLAGTMFATGAMAQSTRADPAAARGAQADDLAQTRSAEVDPGTILVTARRRVEALQDVPLAITALGGEELERAGVRDVRAITQQVPGLQFDGLPGKLFTSPVIRGVSQVSRLDDENNVATFIDGIYVSGRDGLDFSFLDLERVEVVKGPQSALYGRNSFSGAINYITRKPSDTLEAKLAATVGTDETYRFEAAVSGPIVPGVLQARIGALYDSYGGGYENLNDGSDLGGFESVAVLGALRFQPTPDVTADFSTYYADDEIDHPAQLITPGNCEPVTSGFSPRRGAFQRVCGTVPDVPSETRFDLDPRAFGVLREIWRNSLSIEVNLGAATLSSLTGYSELDVERLLDQDRTLPSIGPVFNPPFSLAGFFPLPSLTGSTFQSEEFQQEFRLDLELAERVDVLLGVSYYDLSATSATPFVMDTSALPGGDLAPGQFTLLSRAFGPAGTRPVPADCCDSLADLGDNLGFFSGDETGTRSWAGFGAVDLALTDRLSVRGELRYTSERKDAATVAGFEAEETFTFWTPRVSVSYDSDVGLFYASVARGAKAGGFNTQLGIPAGSVSYDPEFNWTYEVGAKLDLWEDRVRLNVAVFYIDLSGIQITTQVAADRPLFLVQNAGTGESKGGEIELTLRPTRELTFTAGYALADSTFTDAQDFSLRDVGVVPSVDISGQQFPRASKHTVNGALTYRAPISADVDLFSRWAARYESPQKAFTSDILESIGSRFIADMQVGVEMDRLELVAFVQNLTADETPVIAATTLSLGDFSRGITLAAPQPRRFGVTATVRY